MRLHELRTDQFGMVTEIRLMPIAINCDTLEVVCALYTQVAL